MNAILNANLTTKEVNDSVGKLKERARHLMKKPDKTKKDHRQSADPAASSKGVMRARRSRSVAEPSEKIPSERFAEDPKKKSSERISGEFGEGGLNSQKKTHRKVISPTFQGGFDKTPAGSNQMQQSTTASVIAQRALQNIGKAKPATNPLPSFVSGSRRASLASSEKLPKSLNNANNAVHGLRSVSSIEHPIRQTPGNKSLVEDGGKYSRIVTVVKDEKALHAAMAISKAKSASVEELRKLLKQNFAQPQPPTSNFETSMLAKIAGRTVTDQQLIRHHGAEQPRNSVYQSNRAGVAASVAAAATKSANVVSDRNSKLGSAQFPVSTGMSQQKALPVPMSLRGNISSKAGGRRIRSQSCGCGRSTLIDEK